MKSHSAVRSLLQISPLFLVFGNDGRCGRSAALADQILCECRRAFQHAFVGTQIRELLAQQGKAEFGQATFVGRLSAGSPRHPPKEKRVNLLAVLAWAAHAEAPNSIPSVKKLMRQATRAPATLRLWSTTFSITRARRTHKIRSSKSETFQFRNVSNQSVPKTWCGFANRPVVEAL
jgi:hypothetical protein